MQRALKKGAEDIEDVTRKINGPLEDPTLGRRRQRLMWRQDNHILALKGHEKLTYQEWLSLSTTRKRIREAVSRAEA